MPPGGPSYERQPGRLPAPALFGTKMRTALLMLVAVLKETYPAELARYLGSSISSVQRTLDKIEEDGLIATRPLIVRTVTLNPLFRRVKNCAHYFCALRKGIRRISGWKNSRRLRPRRRKKPL